MKIVLSAVAVLILMIGAQNAFGITAYESGFIQGVHDMIHNHFMIIKDKGGDPKLDEYVNGWTLITALGNMDGKNKVEFAKQLYQSGVYKTSLSE